MISERRAIDIALDTAKPELSTGNLSVVPVISTESIVAIRGLPLHIEKIYDAVHRNSTQDRALEEIFNFLSSDSESFLHRARNLQQAIDPVRQPDYSRAYAAAGIAYLLRGLKSHKTGVWLKGKAADNQVKDIFKEVKSADDLSFHELAEWGFKQSVRNEIFWKRQLESLRHTYHIDVLREAIQESDHELVEV